MTPRSPSSSGSFSANLTAARRMTLKVPTRFISTVFVKSPKSWTPFLPTSLAAGPIPAQFTTPFREPKVSTTESSASCTLPSSVTSVQTNFAPLPISEAICSPASSLTSARTTFAPFSARSRAVAAPRPEPPPVTKKVLSSKRKASPLCGPLVFHPHDEGSAGISGGAAGEETHAAAPEPELLDHLRDQARPGRSLRVAEDEAGSVVVHVLDLHPHLPGEVGVVDGERIVRLYDVNARDGDAGVGEGHLGSRYRGLGHPGLSDSREPRGEEPNDAISVSEPACLLLTRDDHASRPVRWVRLGTEGDDAAFCDGLELREALPGRREDARVFVHDDWVLALLRDGDGDHVPLLELAVIVKRPLILLVAQLGDVVELLAAYLFLGCDELARGRHRLSAPRVAGERVLDPVLDLRGAARRRGPGVDHLWTVAGPVRRYNDGDLRIVSLHRGGSRVNAGDGGGASLRDHGSRHIRRPDTGCHRRRAVEDIPLRHGPPEDQSGECFG